MYYEFVLTISSTLYLQAVNIKATVNTVKQGRKVFTVMNQSTNLFQDPLCWEIGTYLAPSQPHFMALLFLSIWIYKLFLFYMQNTSW